MHGDTECCSYTCREDATGFKSCQYLGGCRPAGELCRKDADCCNDAVDVAAGTCDKAVDGLDVGRCKNPGGCAPAGEVCGTSDGSPSGSNECCPGPEGGANEAACQPTASGTHRCTVTGNCKPDGLDCMAPGDCCSGICENGTCGETPCIGDGQPCAFSDQCCSGICAPDPNTGELVCNPDCVPSGQACTANSDCCGGYCNPQTLTCGYIIERTWVDAPMSIDPSRL